MDTTSDSAKLRLLPEVGQTHGLDRVERPLADPLAPNKIGRYLLVEELGRGGMGVVWTAYDPKLDRKVAIKLLRSSRPTMVRKARFIREAQALARLNHPNIVTVHDVDTHEGQLYMAMEYIAGQTLEHWLERRPPWREILSVLDRAGQGLAAAHAAEITHRDFKPSNVLIARDGQVKVLDFGLAKYMRSAEAEAEADEDADPEGQSASTDSIDGAARARRSEIMEVLGSSPSDKLTKFGRIVGTPAYMAPEQYVPMGPHAVGAKADQFSFAVTAYEALYGQLPFAGRDLFEICDNVQEGRLRHTPRDYPVPAWVVRVLQRAMHVDPDDRYPSMSELLAALRADPARRRRQALAYVAGVGLVGLGAFGVAQAIVNDEGPRPCQGAAERFSGVWSEQDRASVEQGLAATGRPFAADTAERVVGGLDRYASEWIEQRTAVCEATRIHGEQSDALLDVRMTCLDRRRGEFSALVGVLATARQDTVTAAVEAVAGLRSPASCATAQAGADGEIPTDPGRRAEYMALRARLDEAHALAAAGQYADARDQAAAAGNSAEGLGFRRLRAEALVTEGVARRELDEPEVARQRLKEGITVASEVGDADTEFWAWNNLLYTAGVLLDDPQRAEDWWFAADNALRRAAGTWQQRAELSLNLGAVMLRQGRLQEATQAGEAVLRIVLEAQGAESLKYAQALHNLGITAAKGADWALAEQRLRQSLLLKKRLLGPSHPDVASNAMNLASVLGQRAGEVDGDPPVAAQLFDEAEALYREVITTREQNDGVGSKSVARTLANLGQLQRRRGKWDEAEASLERALRVLRSLPDARDDLAGTLSILAKLHRAQDDYPAAEAVYREVVTLQRQRHGEEHPAVASTQLRLCRTLMAMERYDDAIVECEHALAVFEAGPTDSALEQRNAARGLLAEARAHGAAASGSSESGSKG